MFWRRQDKPQGDIAGASLTDWWLKTFTKEERDYIANKYRPMGISQKRCLIEGPSHHQDAGKLLLGLSSWFRAPKDRPIERILLNEAIRRTTQGSFERHLAYGAMMVNWYRDRDTDPSALETALNYARKQVAMSNQAAKAWGGNGTDDLPSHQGYEQLAIVAEKQKRHAEAISIARRAKHEGWAGDWDKRIERCRKRLAGA